MKENKKLYSPTFNVKRIQDERNKIRAKKKHVLKQNKNKEKNSTNESITQKVKTNETKIN